MKSVMLNESLIFPDLWIERDGSILCPAPRSRDITSLDFSLWGYVKDNVYEQRYETYEAKDH